MPNEDINAAVDHDVTGETEAYMVVFTKTGDSVDIKRVSTGVLKDLLERVAALEEDPEMGDVVSLNQEDVVLQDQLLTTQQEMQAQIEILTGQIAALTALVGQATTVEVYEEGVYEEEVYT